MITESMVLLGRHSDFMHIWSASTYLVATLVPPTTHTQKSYVIVQMKGDIPCEHTLSPHYMMVPLYELVKVGPNPVHPEIMNPDSSQSIRSRRSSVC